MPSSSGSIRSPPCASANTPISAMTPSRRSWPRTGWRSPEATWTKCHAVAIPPRLRDPHMQGRNFASLRRAPMTPQERQLVADLFERLAELENEPRDAEAEQAIREGLGKAPHAIYALVQNVLVQDEALQEADARIRELEAGGAPAEEKPRGFLASARDALLGREEPRGSVPSAGRGEPMGVPPQYRTGM